MEANSVEERRPPLQVPFETVQVQQVPLLWPLLLQVELDELLQGPELAEAPLLDLDEQAGLSCGRLELELVEVAAAA